MQTVIVPICKNKNGNISDAWNYRPVSLATIISKLFEHYILSCISPLLATTDNQFGFKAKHGTDMCIFLQQTVSYYVNKDIPVFSAFLDASKAFDRTNHNLLFSKLIKRNVPMCIVRLLLSWYRQQTSWDQPGWDALGSMVVNHLMFADDIYICVFSPSISGLQCLLNICGDYAAEHKITFNCNKIIGVLFCPKKYKQPAPSNFFLKGVRVQPLDQVKYLGVWINASVKDDDDIQRQVKSLYCAANKLRGTFDQCSPAVKNTLFHSYYMPMYACQLWSKYTQTSMKRLRAAYNNAYRIMHYIPRNVSVRPHQVSHCVRTFDAVLRNNLYWFFVRCTSSSNFFIQLLQMSDAFYKSSFFLNYSTLLYGDQMQ